MPDGVIPPPPVGTFTDTVAYPLTSIPVPLPVIDKFPVGEI